MMYISFHGGCPGVNNIQIYQDNGQPLPRPNLLPVGGSNPELSELRAFQIIDNLLFVVNGFKDFSQLLVYKDNGKGGYTFFEKYASGKKVNAIFHPYDFTFDKKRNLYISSQDTNVVTGLSGKNTPMPIATYLTDNHNGKRKFMKGTIVASSIGKLPNTPKPYPPKVKKPQGLDVSFLTKKNKKVAHSVRGLVYYKNYLFVADEPADAVKIYSLPNGKLCGQIKGKNLSAPVQLLINNNKLYIGSSGNASMVFIDLSQGVPTGKIKPKMFIDGIVDSISGMTFDPAGNFYAAKRKAGIVLKFPPDGSGKGETFIPCLPDEPEFILYISE